VSDLHLEIGDGIRTELPAELFDQVVELVVVIHLAERIQDPLFASDCQARGVLGVPGVPKIFTSVVTGSAV